MSDYADGGILANAQEGITGSGQSYFTGSSGGIIRLKAREVMPCFNVIHLVKRIEQLSFL